MEGRVFAWLRTVLPPGTPTNESFRTVRSESDLGELLPPRRERRYRSLDKDPFCTDESFFGSGRYRTTGYAPGDRNRAPNFVPRREPRRGPYTGAARPEGPRVHRKFGNNTRERVMPYRRYTHMHEEGFDNAVVGSHSLPSFINPNAALGQSGSAAVLAAAGLTHQLGAGHPGSKHYLLDG